MREKQEISALQIFVFDGSVQTCVETLFGNKAMSA